jgi:uncharacterized phiE125 gp8 family phage protein
MKYWPAKAAGAVEDFGFDFTQALQGGEAIASRTVTAVGATKASDSEADGIVTVWLSGGTNGSTAVVTCTIVTNSTPARTFSETALLPIAEEPVTLEMAKAQCLAQGVTTDDELFLELIQSAREHAEAHTGARLIPAAVEMTFRCFGDLQRLTQAPVQSVTAIEYLDIDGNLQTLGTDVYEFVNVSADVLRPRIRLAFNQTWPAVRRAEDAVRVSATVGYTVVPKPIIRAMLLLIGQWYDNRQDYVIERGVFAQLPNTVASLLANFRR